MSLGKMSTRSMVKGLRKSDATIIPAPDIVKLNFGQLIDLALGQTEDSRNYGAVSFGLLRELLVAIVERMGVRYKTALSYDTQQPPEYISAANSPMSMSCAAMNPIDTATDRRDGEYLEADDDTSPNSSLHNSMKKDKSRLDSDDAVRTGSIKKIKSDQLDQMADVSNRLNVLEQAMSSISKQGLDKKPGRGSKGQINRQDDLEQEADYKDIESRLHNMETGIEGVASVVEKLKNKVTKMNRKLELLDNELTEEQQRAPRRRNKRDSLTDKADNQPDKMLKTGVTADITSAPTDNAGMPGVKGSLEADSNVPEVLPVMPLHELTNEREAERGQVNKLSAVMDNLKQRMIDLEDVQFNQEHVIDRVKRFAIGGFEQVDNQLSNCVTWDKLERHLNGRKAEVVTRVDQHTSALSSYLLDFAEDEVRKSQRFKRAEDDGTDDAGSINSNQPTGQTDERGSNAASGKNLSKPPARASQVSRELRDGSNATGRQDSNTPQTYNNQNSVFNGSQKNESSMSNHGGRTTSHPKQASLTSTTGSSRQLLTSGAQGITGVPAIQGAPAVAPPTLGSPRRQSALASQELPSPDWQNTLGRLMVDSDTGTGRSQRGGPTDSLKKTLEDIGNVSQTHAALTEAIEKVSSTKADKLELISQHEQSADRIQQLEELIKLQSDELISFRELVQHVSAQKVDRDYLTFALSMKLDKKEASELIDMKYFNNHAKFVELSLEEVKNRLRALEQEINFREIAEKLLVKINSKADKEEMLGIKRILQNFDARLLELSTQPSLSRNDEAAAFKKHLVPFNCLSCNKNLLLDGNKNPQNLPVEGHMSGVKSGRPYTSFELKAIRDQLQERDDKWDIYSSPRPVGGAYTMVDPLKQIRNTKTIAGVMHEEGQPAATPVAPPSTAYAYPTINVFNQIVVGQDGKIYKGGCASHTQVEKLPIIPNASPNQSTVDMETKPNISGEEKTKQGVGPARSHSSSKFA